MNENVKGVSPEEFLSEVFRLHFSSAGKRFFTVNLQLLNFSFWPVLYD